VIGVFIGIQVANWNEERRNRLEETALVERIRIDFDRIEVDANRALAYHNEMTSNLRALLRSLRAKKLANEDIVGVERALLLGAAFQTSADTAWPVGDCEAAIRERPLPTSDLGLLG
jgi:hypothetical protein